MIWMPFCNLHGGGLAKSYCKECKRLYDKKRFASGINRTSLEWLINNTDKLKQYQSKSKKKNAGKRNAEWHARRARQIANGGSFTNDEWIELCNKYNNICLSCKKPKPLTKDHVIPIVLGGSNNINNIQPLCQSCNSRKNNATIDYRLDTADLR